MQNNILHETPNHKTTFIHLQFDKKLFAFRYQIYLKGDLLTMIYKCSTTSVGERSLPGVHKSAKRQDGPVLLFQDDCLNLWSEMNQVRSMW